MVNDSIFNNPDLVDAIFEYIFAEFPELAARMTEMKEATRREFRGEMSYIPRRSQAERDKINREVLSLFNGRNATEVARRLQIGRATVYRIIKTEGAKK
jgi:Mor family transcriptional regulator